MFGIFFFFGKYKSNNYLCKRSFLIEITSYEQEINTELVKKADLQLITNNGYKSINGTVVFAIDLKDFQVDVLILIPRLDLQNWALLNVTMDGCEYIEARLKNKINLLYILLQQLQSTNGGFFPKKCPIEKVNYR